MRFGFLTAVLDLLFPTQCVGCGRWDAVLCDQCWLLADEDPTLGAIDDTRGVPQIPLWALGSYGGPLRKIIVAAKHQTGVDLDDFLFHAGCRLGQAASQNVANADMPVWVVAAPSSWRRRWNGHEVTGHLARGVAVGIEEALQGRRVQVVDVFRLRPGAGSQSRRGKDSRRRARRGALRIACAPPADAAVVLVDDVTATGTTLVEMVGHLGINAQVAVVLARA